MNMIHMKNIFQFFLEKGVPIPSISYIRNTNTNFANGLLNTHINAIVLIEDGNVYDTSANPWTYKCQVEVKMEIFIIHL